MNGPKFWHVCIPESSQGAAEHAERIYLAYQNVLAGCSPERLKHEFSDQSESTEFVSLMKRFANDLPWSIEMQVMYDELDVELGDYDRFKTGLTTVYSQAVVVFHQNSEVRNWRTSIDVMLFTATKR